MGAAGISLPSSPSGQFSNTSAFVEKCRQELACCIGPIANVLIDEILAQYPYITPNGFVETLTSHLSDPEQAIAFKRRIQIPSELVSESQSLSSSNSQAGIPSEQTTTSGKQPSANQAVPQTRSSLDASFVDYCRQELIRCIGPIANLLMERVLTNNPQLDRETLVEILSVQIPSSKQAAEFRQRLKNFEFG